MNTCDFCIFPLSPAVESVVFGDSTWELCQGHAEAMKKPFGNRK